jgi:hypothetical protein
LASQLLLGILKVCLQLSSAVGRVMAWRFALSESVQSEGHPRRILSSEHSPFGLQNSGPEVQQATPKHYGILSSTKL